MSRRNHSPVSRDFHLEYYDPPPELSRHVLALFHFVWDKVDIQDRHPGALGQLFLTPIGRGSIHFRDRTDVMGDRAILFSGFDVAAPITVKGPWHSIGASLSPLGWAALTRLPANQSRNRFYPAAEVLGPEIDTFSDDLNARYRNSEWSGREAARALAEWIAPRLHSIPAPHEDLIDRTVAWLGSSLHPEVDNLFATFDYSRRQVERLVARYFGYSPAALARKLRAVRAANLLAQTDLSDEGEAEIAAAFYDQPHMIREIRRYCGHTPTRLGGGEEPLFVTMLRLRNLDRLKQFRRIGQSDSA